MLPFKFFSLNFEGDKLSPWPFFKGQFQLQCGIGAMAQPGSNPDFWFGENVVYASFYKANAWRGVTADDFPVVLIFQKKT